MVTTARVFVATTEGPSEIQHIVEEDPEVRSVICLNGTSEALPVSRDYDSFVRKPTGVIESVFGNPSYRVDVSRRISSGRSWQLGLLLAHALHAEKRLATKDEPADEIYWVTGEVRHSLDVMRVDHVRDKIRQSEALFEGLAHLRSKLTILVPATNLDEAEAELSALGLNRPDVSVEGISRWDEFGIPWPAKTPPAAGKFTQKRLAIILLAIAVPIAAATFLASWWKSAPLQSASVPLQPPLPSALPPAVHTEKLLEPLPIPPPPVGLPPTEQAAVPVVAQSPVIASTPPPEAAATVSAVERRAPPGLGCGRLRLTGDATVSTETVASSGRFDARPSAGLCEVEFRVANPSKQPRLIGALMRSTIDGTAPLSLKEMVAPGAFISLKVTPDAWSNGKAWTATLVVVDLPAGADVSMERPEELAGVKGLNPQVLTYTAEAPEEPRFR